MAFSEQGLIKISNGGCIGVGEGSAKSVFHYATNDADTVVEADGYFDSMADYIQKGDIIIASLDVDGTPEVKMYIVSSVTHSPSTKDVAITAMLIA